MPRPLRTRAFILGFAFAAPLLAACGSAGTGAVDAGPNIIGTVPALPSTTGADYTLFAAAGTGAQLNVHWRPASDMETAAEALEYRVTAQKQGEAASVVLPFTRASSIPTEASQRFIYTVTDVPGTWDVFVSVRDGDGNVVDYPKLNRTF